MITINKFCYCMSLDIGTILLGWLGVILYLTVSIASFKILMFNDLTLFELFGVSFVFTASIIHLADNIALVIGIIKKIHNLLLPWLFGQFLVVMCMIGFQFYIFLLIIHDEYIIFVFLILMFWTGLQAYSWICIYSMYERIKLNRNIEKENIKVFDGD